MTSSVLDQFKLEDRDFFLFLPNALEASSFQDVEKWVILHHNQNKFLPFFSGRIPVAPETPLGAVTLSLPDQSYHQLAKDELVHMLMPQTPLYPNSQFYVPVFLEQQPLTSDEAPIAALTIK